jgi:23S rRNA (guanine745-N1)-methyltransferase
MHNSGRDAAAVRALARAALAGELLQCPVCSEPLELHADNTGREALLCAAGHRYDAARQGYFNLLTGRGTGFQADTAEMVDARAAFLARGHYAPLGEAIADVVSAHLLDSRTGGVRPGEAGRTATPLPEPGAVVLDAGAGTGHYLQQVRRRCPGIRPVALDISKFAIRRAARALPDGLALAWDVWRPLPLADGSVDVILNVFSPRNREQFARVLRSSGLLVTATPAPGHLAEIRTTANLLAFAADKATSVEDSLTGTFRKDSAQELAFSMELSPEDVRHAALMGPAAHHLDRGKLAGAIAELPETMSVSARLTLQAFSSCSV